MILPTYTFYRPEFKQECVKPQGSERMIARVYVTGKT